MLLQPTHKVVVALGTLDDPSVNVFITLGSVRTWGNLKTKIKNNVMRKILFIDIFVLTFIFYCMSQYRLIC